jgi:hypothetical protein
MLKNRLGAGPVPPELRALRLGDWRDGDLIRILVEIGDFDFQPLLTIQLEPKHEANIRQALLFDSRFGEEEYPILLTAPFFEGKFLGDWIIPPDPARVGHNRVYRCLISGMLFTFFVGSGPIDEKMSPLIFATRSGRSFVPT